MLKNLKASPRISRLAGAGPLKAVSFALVLAAIYLFGTAIFSMARTQLLINPVWQHLFPNLTGNEMYDIIARLRWVIHCAEYFLVFILLAVWALRLRPPKTQYSPSPRGSFLPADPVDQWQIPF